MCAAQSDGINPCCLIALLTVLSPVMFTAWFIPSCPFDYIKVYDGASSEDYLIGTYCGLQRSLVVYSSGENLFVQFNTLQRTADSQNRGFAGWFEFSERFVNLGESCFVLSFSCIICQFLFFYIPSSSFPNNACMCCVWDDDDYALMLLLFLSFNTDTQREEILLLLVLAVKCELFTATHVVKKRGI